ncbi:putative Tetratricopeptide repeat (TPR)-like superfamily protein [Hibiscus syriacus]|uniref:Tetratricopeptide repeat (TPR)-like superfamily protein n=1 Tax=Hibiscus syriacus TaxID=106335 RepID=A0A6A2XV57_HIBSY|nr:putative Tetratricopeptide repeat (TPR)-like superfamily protein [Hibiscus syriacus]
MWLQKYSIQASTWENGSIYAPYDEALTLKNKSLEVEPYLNGHSIYLIGLTGSGKTTVGKILSHVLGYSFYDRLRYCRGSLQRNNLLFLLVEKKGIIVWLDVPLETLARRIAAVGTHSRPLLHYEHGDPYTKALKRLSYLLEQRGKNYAKANARVSLEEIAGKLGCRDASDLTPIEIAIEELEQIEEYLKEEGGMATAGF